MNKIIAQHTAEVFNGNPSVDRYYDRDQSTFIDILCCKNSPTADCSSYCTLGTYKEDSGYYYEGKKIGVEIVAACYDSVDFVPNMIASCAFNLIKDGMQIAPSVVQRNVVYEYDPATKTPHVLFMLPFLWGEGLKTRELNGSYISWLYAMPLSDNELHVLDEKGFSFLDKEFEKANIDVCDYTRESIF
ncbi:suppressor of fused domain protein [Sediminispirochaeta bajacaliforniensis]|uniref:suppressor of fused domain protein n=1 Tax=Sediminispirochaeta bajacaliforniensis TaxID=148 RepID=UPI00146A09C9|nr:suppressor of fused domain protein [Sediminispirochaeta bajacaliforniensis]